MNDVPEVHSVPPIVGEAEETPDKLRLGGTL